LGKWDPLNLSGDWYNTDFDKLAWLRAAEVKHGRVAMAAFVGYLFTSAGIFLPGAINFAGMSFEDVGNSAGSDPFAVWEAIGQQARWQIIGSMGVLEFLTEVRQPHYTMGGTPGEAPAAFRFFVWQQVDRMTPAERQEKLVSELKNGRLAMLAMAAFWSAKNIKGSVPLLTPFFGSEPSTVTGLTKWSSIIATSSTMPALEVATAQVDDISSATTAAAVTAAISTTAVEGANAVFEAAAAAL